MQEVVVNKPLLRSYKKYRKLNRIGEATPSSTKLDESIDRSIKQSLRMHNNVIYFFYVLKFSRLK